MARPTTTEKQQQPATDERILDAAVRLFYEKGYHATTMREIAGAIGIKAGSLYNHYASKADVLLRIAHGTMQELLEGGQLAIERGATPRERLRELIKFHTVYHATYRFQARVTDDQLDALDAERRQNVQAVRDAYGRLFRDLLTEGRNAHGWVVADVPVTAFGIIGMCTFVDVWFREGGRLTPKRIGDMYADFILSGLERGARSGPAD